ncbi:hypothetical protein WJX74_001843 [Apatococcus lobatus]|uniref:Uncharacterized protein n=1 Tax=Apatococcus lobatus TaxID=904363 RepID=A0AAW1RET5_9CHLO
MATLLAGPPPDLAASQASAPARSARPQETPEQRQKRKDAEKKKQEHAKRERDKLKQKQAAATAAKAAPRPAESQHFTRQTPFVCNIRFRNDLPEIPCDPKMLVTPLQPERLAEFKLTSLEIDARHEMPVPLDLGIPVSALDIQRYTVPDVPEPLDPADALLLEGDAEEAPEHQAAKGARTRGKAAPVNLPWLMNTTYIQGAQQAKTGAALKRLQEMQAAEAAPLDEREVQIAGIEEGFEAAARPPIHQTDPSLTPVEVLPVFPDEELVDQRSVIIQFDGDPAADDERLSKLTEAERLRFTEHCLVKSFNIAEDSEGKPLKFVAFIAPTDPTFIRENASIDEREAFGNAAEVEYRWVREYNYEVKQENQLQQEYVLRFQPSGVYYTVLGPKLTLRKRSKHKGAMQETTRPSKIILKRKRDDANLRPADEAEEIIEQHEAQEPSAVRLHTGLPDWRAAGTSHMNTGCSCFGIAASSRIPRKTYNHLVPPVFPKDPPTSSMPDREQECQLQALIAYLAATPHCISKVSRRLARAINGSLVVIAAQPLAAREQLQGFALDPSVPPGPAAVVAAEVGHVRLAVQTYVRLLASLSTSDCNLMAQELICTKPSKTDSPVRVVALPAGTGGESHVFSVVGVLLTHTGWQMRAQGLLLLSAFMASQADDTFLRPVENFLSYVCTAATRAVGRVAASEAAFTAERGDVDVNAPKSRQAQAEQNDIQEVRETMATLAGFLQLLHRAASNSRYLLLVQRTVMEALQQIHGASHQHALLAAAASGRLASQALLITPDDPLHGMYALPEAWHACEALGQLTEIEILAEEVVSDMVNFMWQHRCWGVATQAAGLKADFMTIFVEVAATSRRTMWLFRALLKQAAALSGLGDDFSDNEFAGLLGTLVAVADQEGLLQDANAAHVLSLVLQATPLMAAGAKPEAHAAIQDVSTLAVSYMAGMARRQAVTAAVSASLGCLQHTCGRDSMEMVMSLNLMTVACKQMDEPHPHQLEPTIWETIMPRQLAVQLARLCKTGRLPARAATHAMLSALIQKAAALLPAFQAALFLSAIWHEAALKENSCEAFEGMQAVLVEVVRRCPPDALPHALQCLLALRLEAAKAAATQLGQDAPPFSLIMLSGERVKVCAARAFRAQLGPAQLCCLQTMTQAAALSLMERCGLQLPWDQCPPALDPSLFRDEKAARARLQEELKEMSAGQARQDGCMEQLCHSSCLLAATGLDAASLQDILQQPFCPAPILSADPCWHLPKVRPHGYQLAGDLDTSSEPETKALSAANKQGAKDKSKSSRPRTRKSSRGKEVARSLASSQSWKNLDTGMLDTTSQSHTALPSFEDLVMVVKGTNLHVEGCNICILEPNSPDAAKKTSQESRPSQGSRPTSYDGTSAATKHRSFIAQARSCKRTTEERRQLLRSTRKLALEGSNADAMPAVALDISCHGATPPRV